MSNSKSRAEVVGFIVALVFALGIPPWGPCIRNLYLIQIVGALGLGCIAVYFYWRSSALASKCARILISVVVIVAVGWLFWYPINETYQRTHLRDYITVYERNGELWESAEPNKPIKVGPDVTLRSNEPGRVRLTPIIENKTSTEVISSGTDVVVTVNYGTAKPELETLGVYQRMDARPIDRQRFAAQIPQEIYPGGHKKGPNDYITVVSPISRYKIEYSFEGKSVSNCPFKVTDYYWVEIVHALTGKSK